MNMSTVNERTSIGVRRETHERLEEVRPYDSISWDEFLHELADVYEDHG